MLQLKYVATVNFNGQVYTDEAIVSLISTDNSQDTKPESETKMSPDGKTELPKDNTNITNNNQQDQSKNNSNSTKEIKIKKISAKSEIKASKKLKITVQLNQKVKVKYVYVIFNGKIYKGRTNAIGKVTFTIKKSVLKKVLGKSNSRKIKYQVIYGNSKKTKSVKITK